MIPSGVVSRLIPGRVVRTLSGELVFPGMIPGGVASRLLLFIAGGCLFTPATSRRRALGWPVNARRAVATAFAWLTSRLGWRLVLFLSGFLLQIQDCGRPGLAAKGSRLGQRGGVYRELGVWACGAGQQRVHDSRPLSIGFPSLSKGTSHFESREGFGVGLLRSRLGEAKSRAVDSCRGGCQILPGVDLGRLIKPRKFTAVQAKWEFWIIIGCWNGRLCQMRRVEAWEILHWGTPHLGEVIGRWLGSGHSLGCWIGPAVIRGYWGGWAARCILIGCPGSLPSPPSPGFLMLWLGGKSSWRFLRNGGCRGISTVNPGLKVDPADKPT